MGVTANPVAHPGPAVHFFPSAHSTMTKVPTFVRLLVLLGGAAGFVAPVPAQTADQIIAKAREYLGGEAALNAIHSVHYVGTLETERPSASGPKRVKFGLEILVQKPCQQLIVTTSPESTDSTGLDDYNGWHRLQTGGARGRNQVDLLNPAQIRQLRANTWENLFFYKGIEQRGGRAEVIGPAQVDGHPAVKVAFIHDAGIVFFHYFDPNSGQLLFTETDHGGTIREEGEIVANGVRFPQKSITTIRQMDAQGKTVEQTLTVSFDKITCNERFPDSDFEVPLLSLADRPAAP